MKWNSWANGVLDYYRSSRWIRRKGPSFKAVQWQDTPAGSDDALPPDVLALSGSPPKAKWLSFRCPCGCGAAISLNLMRAHKPRWRVTLHSDKTVSVYPSVEFEACGSHFFIEHSTVYWV